jgi:hypothetical protein
MRREQRTARPRRRIARPICWKGRHKPCDHALDGMPRYCFDVRSCSHLRYSLHEAVHRHRWLAVSYGGNWVTGVRKAA